LNDWVGSRPNVAATATFQDLESIPEQVLCSCCVQIPAIGFGLALWNKTPATEQGVAYIPMDARPGQFTASEQRFPNNSIPGWARYFWIDPARNMLVTLIPEGGIRNKNSGLPSARQYLQSFLHAFSPYAITRCSEDGQHFENREILGWRNDPTVSPDLTLAAFFKTNPLSLPGPLDQIRSLQPVIRKLVTSYAVTRDVPDLYSGWERALQFIGWDRYRAPEGDKLNFRFETDWQPTLNELEAEICAWEERITQTFIGEGAGYNRVGIKVRGESGTIWFDKARCIDEVDLGQELENALHWTPDQIISIIQSIQNKVDNLLTYSGGTS